MRQIQNMLIDYIESLVSIKCTHAAHSIACIRILVIFAINYTNKSTIFGIHLKPENECLPLAVG